MLTQGVAELVEAQKGKIREGIRPIFVKVGVKIGFGGVQNDCPRGAKLEAGAGFDDKIWVIGAEAGDEIYRGEGMELMVIWGRRG